MLFAFLVGALCGAGGLWHFQGQRKKDPVELAKESVIAGVDRVRDAIQEKVGEFKAETIRDELNRTGVVIRDKARQAGAVLADAAANARATSAIKAKLLAEGGVAGWNINVDTTAGVVTLSGTAASPEELAKAVRLALDTDGVAKVISTVMLKPK